MSAGKKSQRTKGNVKPSSSSRAAQFLQQEGKTGFVGFTGVAGSYNLPVKVEDSGLDGELKLLSRKMAKRDSITRLKAIQEFTSLLKDKDVEDISVMLSFWPRVFNKLSMDFDHRVREATQQAHYQVCTKSGRNLAPHLKSIIANWLITQFDPCSLAATIAKQTFDTVFNAAKKIEVLEFCKNEVFQTMCKNILHETIDTMSDPNLVPLEEREAKYTRVVSGSFLALNFFLKTDHVDLQFCATAIDVMFEDKKFWKYGKHKAAMIRSSFFQFLSTSCTVLPNLSQAHLSQIAPSVFLALDEKEFGVVKSLWSALLVVVSNYETSWQHVNPRKAVLPKLWKLLRSSAYGNATLVYPSLLPFLSHVPSQIVGEGTGFYNEFFGALKGCLTNGSKSDANLVVRSFVECFQYVLLQNIDNDVIRKFMLHDELKSILDDVFNSILHWTNEFFVHFAVFLKSMEKCTIKHVEDEIWNVIKDCLVNDKGDLISTEDISVLNVVNFVCFVVNEGKGTTDRSIYDYPNKEFRHSENMHNFLCSLVQCFLSRNKLSNYFIEILLHSFNAKLLRFFLNVKFPEQCCLSITNLDVCTTIVSGYMVALLEDLRNVKLLASFAVAMIVLLEDDCLETYLNHLLTLLCDCHTNVSTEFTLHLLTELMNYSRCPVDRWLQSAVVQRKVEEAFNAEGNEAKWDLMMSYIEVLRGEQLASYIDKLLTYLQACAVESKELAMQCFSKISHKDNLIVSAAFLHTWLALFEIQPKGTVLHTLLGKIAASAKVNEFIGLFTTWVKQKYSTGKTCHDAVCEVVNYKQDGCGRSLTSKMLDHLLLSDDEWNKLESDLTVKQNICHLTTQLLASMEQSFLFRDDVVCTILRCSRDDACDKSQLKQVIERDVEFQKMLLNAEIQRKTFPDGLQSLLTMICTDGCVQSTIMDECFTLLSTYPLQASAERLCVVFSFLSDISTIRAFVVQYTSDLQSEVSIDVFPHILRILVCILTKWHDSIDDEMMDDYNQVVVDILSYLQGWVADSNDVLKLGCCLQECDSVNLDVHLMNLISLLLRTASSSLESGHWDFCLCSIVSWLQTCEETVLTPATLTTNNVAFYCATFHLFFVTATIFNEYTYCSLPPLIDLCEAVSPSTNLPEVLFTEWKEFFSLACYSPILKMFLRIQDTPNSELESALCACVQYISRGYLLDGYLYEGTQTEKQKKESFDMLYVRLNHTLKESNGFVKIASYHILAKLSDIIERDYCQTVDGDQCEQMRTFPTLLLTTMNESKDETISLLSSEDVAITSPLTKLPHAQNACLLTYIMSCQLIIQIFKMASPSNRALLANYFHRGGLFEELITCVCCVTRTGAKVDGIESKLKISDLSFKSLQSMAVHLYGEMLASMPALVRSWFNKLERMDSKHIDKFTSAYISPTLLKREFKQLNTASDDASMRVKVMQGAREIIAKYSIEDMTMELVLTLPVNYPLTSVSIECGKRFGVRNSEWRQWMLQLNTFLSFQNGAVCDGLEMWKSNVNKRFDGVEECMICFSIIHPSNYSLPNIACKTCKKKFHPICLYKWFGTSGKSTCPLCRDVF